MKRTFWLLGMMLATLALASTPLPASRYYSLQNGFDPNASQIAPQIEIASRNALEATFTVRIEGFTITNRENGVSIELGGKSESQAPIGSPDITSLTVFLPFNSAVTASATASVVNSQNIPVSRLGTSVARVVDPEFPVNASMTTHDQPQVVVGTPGVFRDFGVVPVTVYPVRQLADGSIEAVQELSIRITASTIGEPLDQPILASWDNLYRTFFLGYDDFSIGRSRLWRPGTYLILRTNNTNLNATFNAFANWKRLEGYNVIVRTVGTGTQWTTTDQIKTVINSLYASEEIPLEYVLLQGDADRGSSQYQIPTYRFLATGSVDEYVCTDHNYVTLSGSDQWPEALIGRFSGSDVLQWTTYMRRTVLHQNEPHSRNHAADSVLCFAGNFSDAGAPPVTPVWNAMWAADLLRSHGYYVDEIYYPPTYPGDIPGSISQGKSYVFYRGWGDAGGPLYPRFRIADISTITGYYSTPFVSIVCKTGAFGANAETVSGQCFGEAWCETGSTPQATWRGGPAFFGASHLHTNTRYNNPMLGGFMQGWLEEGLDKLGLLTLRSKLELYRCYPLEPDYTDAYFKYYNILGDPSLQFWVRHANDMTVQFPTTIDAGMSTVTVRALNASNSQPLSDRVVSVLVGNNLYQSVGTTNSSGYATLNLRAIQGDSVKVSVRGGNYRPITQHFICAAGAGVAFRVDSVRMSDGNNGRPEPGEEADLTVYIKNVSTASANSQATLTSLATDRVQVVDNSSTGATIPANGTATLTFRIRVIATNNWNPFPMRLTFATGNRDFAMPTGFIFPTVQSFSVLTGSLNPGQNATIRAVVKNEGSSALPVGTVNVSTFSNGLTITQQPPANGIIAPNATANIDFQVHVSGSIIAGHVIPLRILFNNTNNQPYALAQFNLPCGTRSVRMPAGPDLYGYYAYEDIDTGYIAHPTYSWSSIDPAEGGQGTLHWLDDDANFKLRLPFPVQFYGDSHSDSITVCSNGWLSFENTWQIDFYNYPMPNAQGPSAMIAANWDDLKGIQTAGDPVTSDSVKVWHWYDSTTGRLVFQWGRSFSRYGIEGENRVAQRFQVILYRDQTGPNGDNDIDIMYHQASDVDVTNNYTTVGTMNWHHTDGLNVTFAKRPSPGCDTLRSNRAIRFTTRRPDSFLGANNPTIELPKQIALHPAYPNPFNPITTAMLSLPSTQVVTASVYDLTGREVARLFSGQMAAGNHELRWNATGASTGVYFLRVQAGSYLQQLKLIYLR